MTGKAVLRTLIVITLIVTAHTVRPFSVRNITSQLFSTAGTLKTILPDSAQAGFSNANLLATTLTRSWFDENAEEPVWYGDVLARTTEEKGEPVAVPVKMSKAVIGRGSSAVRIARNTEDDDQSDNLIDPAEAAIADIDGEEALAPISIAFSNQVELPADSMVASIDRPAFLIPAGYEAPAGVPVSLPEVDDLLGCALNLVRPVVGTDPAIWMTPHFAPHRTTSSCDEQSARQIRLIALIEEKKAKQVDAVLSSLLECEDETTETKTSSGIPIETGPEFTSFGTSQPAFPLQVISGESSSCNPNE
ncbi:MAG: hypothetical protein IPM66_13375 [Acidobacteriota bacterium]|nr:MAG: hypothetical protein IPM66_13375 [Acidobacteriota bacterium]